jgi:hypothetical protein
MIKVDTVCEVIKPPCFSDAHRREGRFCTVVGPGEPCDCGNCHVAIRYPTDMSPDSTVHHECLRPIVPPGDPDIAGEVWVPFCGGVYATRIWVDGKQVYPA